MPVASTRGRRKSSSSSATDGSRGVDRGTAECGSVTFEPANGASKTHIHVELEYEPKSIAEKIGSALQVDEMVVGADLERFKDLVEERRTPTGEWEGRIESGRVTDRN